MPNRHTRQLGLLGASAAAALDLALRDRQRRVLCGTAALLGLAAELLTIALRDAVLQDLNLERKRLLTVAVGLGGEFGDQLGDPSEQHAVFGLQHQHASAQLTVLSKQPKLLCGGLLG